MTDIRKKTKKYCEEEVKNSLTLNYFDKIEGTGRFMGADFVDRLNKPFFKLNVI